MFEDLVVVWFRSCCFKKIVSVSITLLRSDLFLFLFSTEGFSLLLLLLYREP